MKELLLIIHTLMAILCVWRLTELFTIDRITQPLRNRFKTYLLTCPRCLSIWAGCYAALSFYFLPWLNWPFALAWIYLWHNEIVVAKAQQERGRRFSVELAKDGRFNIKDNELHPTELNSIMQHVFGTGPSKNATLN